MAAVGGAGGEFDVKDEDYSSDDGFSPIFSPQRRKKSKMRRTHVEDAVKQRNDTFLHNILQIDSNESSFVEETPSPPPIRARRAIPRPRSAAHLKRAPASKHKAVIHSALVSSKDGKVSKMNVVFQKPNFGKGRLVPEKGRSRPSKSSKKPIGEQIKDDIAFLEANSGLLYSDATLDDLERQFAPVRQKAPEHVGAGSARVDLIKPLSDVQKEVAPLRKLEEILESRKNGDSAMLCTLLARVKTILHNTGWRKSVRQVVLEDADNSKYKVRIVFLGDKQREIRKLRVGDLYIFKNFAIPDDKYLEKYDVDNTMNLLKTVSRSLVVPYVSSSNTFSSSPDAISKDAMATFESVAEMLRSRRSGRVRVKAHVRSVLFQSSTRFNAQDKLADLPIKDDAFMRDIDDFLELVYLSCSRCGEEMDYSDDKKMQRGCKCRFYGAGEQDSHVINADYLGDGHSASNLLWSFRPLEVVIGDGDDAFNTTVAFADDRNVISSLFLIYPEQIVDFKTRKADILSDKKLFRRLKRIFTGFLLCIASIISNDDITLVLDRHFEFDENFYVRYADVKLVGVEM